MQDFVKALHPETNIDNFSRFDGTITFFSFVKGAMKRVGARKVLDYGAGRGSFFYINSESEGSLFKRELMDLRTDGAEVWACDIDDVVLTHPASDHQVHIKPGERLPFEDETFDVIVSEVTFEHIAEPEPVARELLRVLKPGGYICARTPNKYGYVTVAARIVPNRKHSQALKWIAPAKHEMDIFPTVFKMNTVGTIKKLFAGCDVYWYRESAQPSYFFGNSIIYRLMLGLHAILPNVLATSLCVFIKKPK
ncbi:MAG: class I SAM-dependent methyltransferase [Sphingomonas sp.]